MQYLTKQRVLCTTISLALSVMRACVCKCMCQGEWGGCVGWCVRVVSKDERAFPLGLRLLWTMGMAPRTPLH
jgi:hypothetical protein